MYSVKKNTICHRNYRNYYKKSVSQCKQICKNNKNCTGFSFPIHGKKTGCRVARRGSCRPGKYKGYTYYSKKNKNNNI